MAFRCWFCCKINSLLAICLTTLTALGDCRSAFPADTRGCSKPWLAHLLIPMYPGEWEMRARLLPKPLSKPVKASPGLRGRASPVLRACTRQWGLHQGVGQHGGAPKSPSSQQSSARGANHGSAFWMPHMSDGWGEGWEVTAPLSSQQPRAGPSLGGSGQSSHREWAVLYGKAVLRILLFPERAH